MHVLYYLAIILITGIIMARVVSLFKLPNVTGYLLAGLIIGPSFLNIVSSNKVPGLSVVSEAALGFIAYSIGSEFEFNHLKKLGKGILWITVLEALGAVVVVDIVMIFIFKQPIAFSIVIGAIAAATAPAATIMVIRQYKAQGPVVDTLLPVVAMDDAVSIMAFGISMAVAKSITGYGQVSMAKAIFSPFLEIILAFLIGIIIGLILSFVSTKTKGESELLTVVISALFLAIGIAKMLDISALLVCMMIGATVANVAPNSDRVLSVAERFTPPIFIAFFTIAGADLDISILKDVGIIGVGYVVFRIIGKVLGASLGAYIADSPKTVKKYLGFTLIPQAGVAIGLSMIAQDTMPTYGMQLRTIILSATVIYELIGPVMTKIALMKAGEINIATK